MAQVNLSEIRSRLSDYPQQAQDDIQALLRAMEDVGRDAVVNYYTETFERVYSRYPNARFKFESFKAWKSLVDDGISEVTLEAVVNAYVLDTPRMYVRALSNFFSKETRYFDDYLSCVVLDPTKEPDWHPESGKLIRNMKSWEKIYWKVPECSSRKQ